MSPGRRKAVNKNEISQSISNVNKHGYESITLHSSLLSAVLDGIENIEFVNFEGERRRHVDFLIE